MHIGINVKHVSKRSPIYHLNQWWIKSNPDLLNDSRHDFNSVVTCGTGGCLVFSAKEQSDYESNTYIFPLKDKDPQLYILQPDCCTKWRVPWLSGGDQTSASWVLLTCLTHFSSWQWSLNITLQLRHNEHYGVSNHQSHDCLSSRLFRRRSKKISKLRVTGLCAGKSPVTGEFPAQRASNAENIPIWWRHHEIMSSIYHNPSSVVPF